MKLNYPEANFEAQRLLINSSEDLMKFLVIVLLFYFYFHWFYINFYIIVKIKMSQL